MSENTLRDLKEEGTRLQAAFEGGKRDVGASLAFVTRAVTGICGEMLNLREGTPSLRSHEELTERVDRLSNPRVLTLETQVAELMKRAAVADALAEAATARKDDMKWVVGGLCSIVVTLVLVLVWFFTHVPVKP